MTGFRGVLVDAGAGAIATGAMSGVIVAGDRAGLMSEPPPTTITRRALRGAGVEGDTDDALSVAAPLAHIGFGALGGVVYSLVRRVAPGIPGPLLGILVALGIYGVSYKGWVPALGILPPPEQDRPGRPAVMILAHVVYGLVLGLLIRRPTR